MIEPFTVRTDKGKNRLYVDFYLNKEEQAEKMVDEIWIKAKQLNAGWGCIANYTAFNVPLTVNLLEVIETIMSFLKPLGMGQLVRVLTEKQSSLGDELKKRSINIGGYEGIVARTLQDADTILDHTPD